MNALGKPKVIVVCGPTGIGKTALSLSLAEEFSGEIVGADSMQIYKKMDIGTAKPGAEELSRVPHHMIDIVDPDDPYDAARYAADGREAIFDIFSRNRVPFVVGGTGLYIKTILHGLFRANPADPEIRSKLKNDAVKHGSQWVYEKLKACDPEAAARIHQNDTYRVIRALEIYEISGQTMTQYQKDHGFRENLFDVLKVCLMIDRKALYERINRRVDQMLEEGLLDEVKRLLSRGYADTLKPMQSIGYRHMSDFINGQISWDEAVYTLKRDTRRYAKRQLTWFRKDKDMIWKEPSKTDEVRSLIVKFL